MSQDVYANPATPLTVIGGGGGGGGTAPGNVPAPVAGTITSTSIEISFDVAGVTGTQPISYNAGYATSPGGILQLLILSFVGTVYSSTASGLTPNTPYFFKVTATNTAGQGESPEQEIATAAGGTPPGNVPNAQFLSATSTSITTYIDTAGVTGDVPITYFSYYGLVPGTFTALSLYNLSSGTIYTASPSLPFSTFYFQTRAVNAFGGVSTIAPFPAFSTLGAP
jgi:hypothetical protein